MKKSKKILVMLVATCITLSVGLNVSAASIDVQSQANNNEAISYANDLKAYINNTQANTSESTPIDQLVTNFISKNGSKYNAESLANSTQVETINIDANDTVTIKQGVVYVKGNETVAATPDRIAKGAIDVSNKTLSASSSGVTPIVSYSYTAYGAIAGQKLWEVTQEAQFTYTGSSVKANYAHGSYTRGTLSLWQVQNWEDSSLSTINDQNGWEARAMSSGNFNFGIEVEGVGIVVQDVNCWVDARCTYNGLTTGYYELS
jgi:hypothetical protein